MDITVHQHERRKNGERRKQYTAPALPKGLDTLELLATESNGLMLKKLLIDLDVQKVKSLEY